MKKKHFSYEFPFDVTLHMRSTFGPRFPQVNKYEAMFINTAERNNTSQITP